MIKIIHCADIHLGSKIEAKLPHDKTLERRKEVRATFNRMIDYAVRGVPQIDFYISAGITTAPRRTTKPRPKI